MNEKRKTLKWTIYVVVLLFAIIVLFQWYTRQNNRRIERQNLNYALDSAHQTAENIERELENAQNRLGTYAFFLGEGLAEGRR